MKKIHVALVGLGFGRGFAPIYLSHPDVAQLTLCDADRGRLETCCEGAGEAARRVLSLDEVLRDPDIDAVHLNTGIPDHARQAIAVLQAGKHCACTVPMATTIDDIRAVISAARESRRNYMMMETQCYAREFLHACELRDQGVFGRLQLMRGFHYQDMENWAPYWAGLPPMWYATHAIGPLLSFARTRARSVHCYGSGFMRDELKKKYGNPYPVETAIFDLEREIPLAMEVTRALFHTARGYAESFNFYGEDATLEWNYHDQPMVLSRQTKLGADPGRSRETECVPIGVPDYGHLLPPEIAGFTGAAIPDGRGNHPSVRHGGGHGGSHPHLVHEFVRSVVENRRPAIDEIKAANWTAPGICAHQSALERGARVMIPGF